ncbi:MAG: response regulator [Thiomicrorhabdus sp.]|nr:response regulator [Thiomicrorhabdus sp.]
MNSQFSGSVLVVEDNIVNQKLTCAILKKTGLDFEIANHGEEAVALWKRNNFDLILMDCQMPIMDGYAATQKIRQMETSAHIPIIALTASAAINDDIRCIDSGMDDLLCKPFTIPDFISILKKWLPKSSIMNHSASESPYLNQATINELKKLLEDDFFSVVDIYIKSTAHIMNEMMLAYQSGQYSEIQRLAHSLKSSSESVGAIKIASLAKELEQQLIESVSLNIPSKIEEINKVFISTTPALVALQGSCRPGPIVKA